MQKTALYYIFLFFLLFSACKKDVPLNTVVQIDSINVNDSITVPYQDSLVFVSKPKDTTSFEFKLNPSKYEAFLRLDVNNENSIDSNFITVDSTFSEIALSIPENYYTTFETKSTEINHGSHSFLDSIALENSASTTFSFEMNDNSRGYISFDLYNLLGQIVANTISYKTDNSFFSIVDVSQLTPQLYIGRIIYGNEDRTFTVLVQ